MQPRGVLFVFAACLICAAAQLADNLIVSGSNRPFAEGVGTYGLPKRGEGGLVSNRMPSVLVTDRASGAYFADGRGNTTRYDSTASALLALARYLGRDISRQVNEGRRLLQQPAAKRNTSDLLATGFAAARQYFAADSQLQHKPGGLPTVSTQDGNFQIISNNDSGNELQIAKDGTITIVNGGLSPGIFSIGPSGVTLNKDNALGPIQAVGKAIVRAASGADVGADSAAEPGAFTGKSIAGLAGSAGPAGSLQAAAQRTAASSTGLAAQAGVASPPATSAQAGLQFSPELGSVQQAGSVAQQDQTRAAGSQQSPAAAAFAEIQPELAHAPAVDSAGKAPAQLIVASGLNDGRAALYHDVAAPFSASTGVYTAGASPTAAAPLAGRRLLRQ